MRASFRLSKRVRLCCALAMPTRRGGSGRYIAHAGGCERVSGAASGILSSAAVFVLLCSLLLLSACSDPMRIPRIEPVLYSWSTPYKGVDGIVIHVFNTGRMRMPAAAVYKGGSWATIVDLDVPAFVIEHPKHGLIVFDTGLNDLARTQPDLYLGWLIGQLDLIDKEEGRELPEQMREASLDPDSVKTVVLSHMHFDHTGSLESFPAATVIVADREKDAAGRDLLTGSFFVEGEYDEVENWHEIDYGSGEPYATFISHYDLFGDDSIIAVDLAGHTAGSQGLIVKTPGAPVLLTGDAAWMEESWRFAAPPIDAYDMKLWWEQVWRIKKFASLEPSLIVIPGHDLSVLDRVDLPAIIRH